MIEVNKLSNEEVERVTLDWVNEQRNKYGMKPLKKLRPGKRSDRNYCVIARSLRNGEVNYTSTSGHTTKLYKTKGGTVDLKHPPSVVEFINRFDSTRYPDLIYKPPS